MRRRLRVALFSHDSLGLGHIRRNRALAFALARDLPALTGREVSGLLIASSPEAARFDLPDGWDWVILPGVTPAPGGYVPRALASSMQGLRALRAAAVSAILDQQRPELFIVDRHPFGIGGELAEAIDQVRGHGCRTVLGLREVLDTPSVIDAEWEKVGGSARVADAFDEVWIYGDPDVYDPRSTGEVPATLAARAVTTGYLSQDRPDDGGALPEGVEAARVGSAGTESPGVGSQRFVLTCLGGGSDGGSLAAIAVDSPDAGRPRAHRPALRVRREPLFFSPHLSLSRVPCSRCPASARSRRPPWPASSVPPSTSASHSSSDVLLLPFRCCLAPPFTHL